MEGVRGERGGRGGREGREGREGGRDDCYEYSNRCVQYALFTPGPLLAESEVRLALEQNWLE